MRMCCSCLSLADRQVTVLRATVNEIVCNSNYEVDVKTTFTCVFLKFDMDFSVQFFFFFNDITYLIKVNAMFLQIIF